MSRNGPAPADRRHPRKFAFLFVLLIMSIVAVDALIGDKGLLETLRVERRYYALQSEIDRLKRENARLAEEAQRLRTDPEAIEGVARSALGLMRPGERVFIVRTRPAGNQPSDTTPPGAPPDSSGAPIDPPALDSPGATPVPSPRPH